MEEIDWPTPHPPTRPRVTCAVCGLRAKDLICKECANRPTESIRWLEQLPTSARVQTALMLLKTL